MDNKFGGVNDIDSVSSGEFNVDDSDSTFGFSDVEEKGVSKARKVKGKVGKRVKGRIVEARKSNRIVEDSEIGDIEDGDSEEGEEVGEGYNSDRLKAIRDSRTLPKAPGKRLIWEEFDAYLKSLTLQHWNRLLCYVYRTYPIINTRKFDPTAPKHIEKISQPFDEEYIKERHGGGKYLFTLIDTDAKSKIGNSNIVASALLTIPESEAKPILDYRYLDMGHPDNKFYVQGLMASGVIDAEGNEVAKKEDPLVMKLVDKVTSLSDGQIKQMRDLIAIQAKNQSQEPFSEVMKHVMEMMTNASAKSNDFLLKQLENQSPASSMAMIAPLLGVLKGDGGQQTISLMQNMMQMQREEAKQREELILKMIERDKDKDSKKDDFFETVNKYKQLKDLLGAGKGESAGIVETLISNADKILSPIAQIVSSIANVKGQQQLMQGKREGNDIVIPTNETPKAVMIDDTVTDHMLRGVNKQAMENEEVSKSNLGDTRDMMIKQILDMAGQRIFEAVVNGEDPVDFADTVICMYGETQYRLIEGIGEDRMLESISKHEVGIKLISMGESYSKKLEAFVRGFMRAGKVLLDEDTEKGSEGNEDEEDSGKEVTGEE